jgi:hypothetical protein
MYYRHMIRDDRSRKERESVIYFLVLVFLKQSEQKVAMEWAFSASGVNKKRLQNLHCKVS